MTRRMRKSNIAASQIGANCPWIDRSRDRVEGGLLAIDVDCEHRTPLTGPLHIGHGRGVSSDFRLDQEDDRQVVGIRQRQIVVQDLAGLLVQLLALG